MSETTATPSVAYDQEQASTVLQKQRLLAAQAKRITILQAEIKDREDEVESLKATILGQWPAGSYEAGNLKISIRPGAKTINAKRFEKLFPAEQYPDYYKLSVDTALARKQLGEEQLAPTFTSRKPTVVIA